jgi:hypothetical protein
MMVAMLFQTRFHEAIRSGEITCTVRIWRRPHVRIGGRYRLGQGAIEVDRILEAGFDALTPALARRTGFASLVELLKVAKHGHGERVFIIDFHYVDRTTLGPVTDTKGLDRPALTELLAKLDAMDARSRRAWTRETLRAIAKHPGTRATDLAAELGRERDEFKKDVRKLKALGLTLSLEVGYRVSPRGSAVLEAAGSARAKRRPARR